jgi:hypothetical protein
LAKGAEGVYRNNGSWTVRPFISGVRVYGGTYPTLAEAKKQLKKMKDEYSTRPFYKVGQHLIFRDEVHPSVSVNCLRKRIMVEKWDIVRAKTEAVNTQKIRKKPYRKHEALWQGKLIDLREYEMHPKVTYKLAKQRMKQSDFTLEEALMTPPDRDWRIKEEWKAGDIIVPADMVALARKNGITYDQVVNRLKTKSMKKPWTVERAVTEPVRKKNPKDSNVVRTPKADEIKQYKKVALSNGIPLDVYMKRVYTDKIQPKEAAGMGR